MLLSERGEGSLIFFANLSKISSQSRRTSMCHQLKEYELSIGKVLSVNFQAPTATAIERIKADIEKVAPSATKRNDDGSMKLF